MANKIGVVGLLRNYGHWEESSDGSTKYVGFGYFSSERDLENQVTNAPELELPKDLTRHHWFDEANQLSPDSKLVVLGTIQLLQSHSNISQVIFSGGPTQKATGIELSEAKAAQHYTLGLDVLTEDEFDKIKIEEKSHDTKTNFEESLPLIPEDVDLIYILGVKVHLGTERVRQHALETEAKLAQERNSDPRKIEFLFAEELMSDVPEYQDFLKRYAKSDMVKRAKRAEFVMSILNKLPFGIGKKVISWQTAKRKPIDNINPNINI